MIEEKTTFCRIDQRVIEPLSGMAFLNGFPVAVEAAPAANGGGST